MPSLTRTLVILVLFGALALLGVRQATMYLEYDTLFKGIDLVATIVLTPLPFAAIAICGYSVARHQSFSNGQLARMFGTASLLLIAGAVLAFVLFFTTTY